MSPEMQFTQTGAPAIKLVKARLKSERVEDMLKEVPGWQLQHGDLALDRVRSFPTSEIAVTFAAFAEKLATHAKVTLSAHVLGGTVLLTLHNLGVRGRLNPVNLATIALAKQLG
jgi:pterin-4a-carbinolamine dehydratase